PAGPARADRPARLPDRFPEARPCRHRRLRSRRYRSRSSRLDRGRRRLGRTAGVFFARRGAAVVERRRIPGDRAQTHFPPANPVSFSNPWFTAVLLSVIGLYLLEWIAVRLNWSHLRPEPPDEFAGLFDAEAYAKSQ